MGNESVSIGEASTVTSHQGGALGGGSQAGSSTNNGSRGATAVGFTAKAMGAYSTSLGYASVVEGQKSSALGYKIRSKEIFQEPLDIAITLYHQQHLCLGKWNQYGWIR